MLCGGRQLCDGELDSDAWLPWHPQEDDEGTLEADEALITEEERKEELSALQRESELPLEDLLNAYKLMRGWCSLLPVAVYIGLHSMR